MKIWIDKHGGMHYHKADCKVIQFSEHPPHFKYEEVEHRVRRYKYFDEYADIIVDGKRYRACPFCFGHGGRR